MARLVTTRGADVSEGINEKAALIREDHLRLPKHKDRTTRNVYKIEEAHIHNPILHASNRYEVTPGRAVGAFAILQDSTVLVNGLPTMRNESKRRGVGMCEAFGVRTRSQQEGQGCGTTFARREFSGALVVTDSDVAEVFRAREDGLDPPAIPVAALIIEDGARAMPRTEDHRDRVMLT